ncbi:MAG: hypothetical protein INR71_14110, partial [Terriglobus roseus]|nr:hypothetical protein [Terriglobus roseus]
GDFHDPKDGVPDEQFVVDFASALSFTSSLEQGLSMTGKTVPALPVENNPFVANPPFALANSPALRWADSILLTAMAETVFGLSLNARAFYPASLELWDARMTVFAARLTNTYVPYPSHIPIPPHL